MKCPKCNYVSFDGVPTCKKCGFVFSQSNTSGAGEDIKSIIAEMKTKNMNETRGDEPPALDKTVSSIRESLDEIEGNTSEGRESPGRNPKLYLSEQPDHQYEHFGLLFLEKRIYQRQIIK